MELNPFLIYEVLSDLVNIYTWSICAQEFKPPYGYTLVITPHVIQAAKYIAYS